MKLALSNQNQNNLFRDETNTKKKCMLSCVRNRRVDTGKRGELGKYTVVL